MKQLLKNTDARRARVTAKYSKSKSYYFNENDITARNAGESKTNEEGKDDPLRSADNRVSNNFHQILIDQKADYVASSAPIIDVEDDKLNDKIADKLGDRLGSTLNQLVVDASLAGVAWLHVWHDADNELKYAVIPPDQVTPIYSDDADPVLLAVRRTYNQLDPDTGKQYSVHEYWTDKDVTAFKSERNTYSDLQAIDNRFTIYDASSGDDIGTSSVYQHNMGVVPFIPFKNNKFETPDLDKYKGLIDVYDKVYNGFVNDVDDVQQVILVLTNYGGANLDQFKHDLKNAKAIKLNSIGPGDKSGVDKLTIDIPVEARNSLLEQTFEKIFVFGQGVNPTKLEAGNNTGVAIKMMYSNLELKVSTVQTWFENGLAELVRIIMRDLKVTDADKRSINQTWTRASIRNDVEQADIVSKLSDVTSRENTAKGNPLVNNWQEELELQDDDAEEKAQQPDPFANPNPLQEDDDDDKKKDDVTGDDDE